MGKLRRSHAIGSRPPPSALARAPASARVHPVPTLVLLAPLLFAFEVWQLVISERYLGIKQIEHDIDPRTLGPGEASAFFWSTGILLSWAWMTALLFEPMGRVQAVCMLAVSGVGFVLRRNCGLKRVLVILTVEGAIRVGMLMSLMGMAWRSL